MKMETKYPPYPIDLKFLKAFLFALFFFFSLAAGAQVITVEAFDNSASEDGPTQGSFRVFTSQQVLQEIIVTYSVGGSATPGDDYQALTGTVTIPFFGAQAQIDLAGIVDDALIEGTEDVTVTLLTTSVGVIGNPNTATLEIADNDTGTVELNLNQPPFDPNASEEGPDSGTFRITISAPNNTAQVLTVNYTIQGSADEGDDFTISGAVDMTFNNNGTQVNRNLVIDPIDDNELENAETVELRLDSTDNPSFTIGANDRATVIIEDNDCAAGDTAPQLSANSDTFCDTLNVNLDDYFAGTEPNGASLIWSSNADPSVTGGWLPDGGPTTTPGTYYAFFRDPVNECYSPTSEFDLILNTTPSPGTPSNGNACIDGEFGPTTVDLDDLLSGTVDPGTWTQTGGPATENPNGNNVVNFSNGVVGIYQYTYTTNSAQAPCTNRSSVVSITVEECDPCLAGDNAPVLDTSVPTIFCDDITQSLNDYTNSTPPAGTTLTWSINPDPLILSGHRNNSQVNDPVPGTYFGFFYDPVNACASPTLEITLVENPTPSITAANSAERCGPGSVTLTAQGDIPGSANDPDVNWYTTATGGTPVFTGTTFNTPNLAQTTSYFVEASANGCTSSPRVEIVATIVPQPSAGIPTNTSSCSDPDNGPTVVDLDDQLEGEDVGVWTIIDDPSGDLTISTTNEVNFEGRPDGDYVFRFTTTGAEAPCENEFSEVSISVNDCDVDTDMDGLFDGPEALLGTDPNNPDTDGDGEQDGAEVGDDIENPLDEDGDGIIDALESNILDSDNDGVVDQQDPANDNPCIPDNTNALCDTDGDGITDGDEIANGSDPLDPCDPNLTPDCEPDPIDLEITKSVNNEDATVGEVVQFTIQANNLSDSRVLGTKIGDLLEMGFQYISHTASLGSYDPQTGEWDIFEMQPLESATLLIEAEVLDSGPYTNTAELLESFPVDGNVANNSQTVTLNIDLPEGVDLVLTKKAVSENPLVGDEVVFTIEVINESREDTVSDIQVVDIITEAGGFFFLSATADLGAYNESSGIWTIPSLTVGQRALLQITVRVPNEGNFTNTATISRSSPADGNPDNNEATVEVRVSLPTEADPGFVFNQFSPNGDGTNDFLKVRDIGTFMGASITIFNRYGNLVFESASLTQDEVWDGTRNNEQVPDGTYYYILDLGDGSEVRKGWIQLIR